MHTHMPSPPSPHTNNNHSIIYQLPRPRPQAEVMDVTTPTPMSADDDDDTDSSDESKGKGKPKGKGKEPDTHCSINFVKNTKYKLLVGGTNRVWAEGKARDPSPAVPSSRVMSCDPGDYILFSGDDIHLLNQTGKNKCVVNFEPEDEFILASDWSQFDGAMSGSDLAELGPTTFLLWWQNIAPPKVEKPKPPTKPKKPTTGRKR